MEINEQLLDRNDDGLICLNNVVYSGSAVEHSINGKVIRKWSYVNGHLQGAAFDWFPSGQLKKECSYFRGTFDGDAREWYECGNLRSESKYERGILTHQRVWDEKGILKKEYVLPNDMSDANYAILIKRRQINEMNNQ